MPCPASATTSHKRGTRDVARPPSQPCTVLPTWVRGLSTSKPRTYFSADSPARVGAESGAPPDASQADPYVTRLTSSARRPSTRGRLRPRLLGHQAEPPN